MTVTVLIRKITLQYTRKIAKMVHKNFSLSISQCCSVMTCRIKIDCFGALSAQIIIRMRNVTWVLLTVVTAFFYHWILGIK